MVSDVIASRPKSARHARPVSSIRILALTMSVRDIEGPWLSKTYPLEVPVDHSLAVHKNQAFCDIS